MRSAHKQLSEGSIICGRYRIERHLGRGFTGDTYTCRDLSDSNTKRVIKILVPSGSAHETTKPSGQEFSLLSKLRHPSLARVLDFGAIEDSENLFLTQEWVAGQDLYSGTQDMDAESILGLIAELSRAIQYLHARGIVHGNLKPSNVMLIRNGSSLGAIKLLDFGLKPWPGNPAEMDRCGILAYTAPEVLLGERPNSRSDIYSLGILAYQLLARRLPFEDEDSDFLIQKHLHGSVDLRPIESLRGGVYASQLMIWLLDKDPAKRPASGEEISRFVSNAFARDFSEMDILEMESCFSASQFVGREEEMLFCRKELIGFWKVDGGKRFLLQEKLDLEKRGVWMS